MDRYVGLDAHSGTCTLAVMSQAGRRLTSRVVETNGSALIEGVRSMPGDIHLCLEEGTQSAWLHELFSTHVAEIVVAVPEESRGPKDDLRDVWSRAEDIRTGRIRTRVCKAPKLLAGLRSAASALRLATQDVVRVKNRLKAVLRSRGIATDRSLYAAASRSKWLEQLPFGYRQLGSGSVASSTSSCLCETRPRSGCSRNRSRIRSSGSCRRRLGWVRSGRRSW